MLLTVYKYKIELQKNRQGALSDRYLPAIERLSRQTRTNFERISASDIRAWSQRSAHTRQEINILNRACASGMIVSQHKNAHTQQEIKILKTHKLSNEPVQTA